MTVDIDQATRDGVVFLNGRRTEVVAVLGSFLWLKRDDNRPTTLHADSPYLTNLPKPSASPVGRVAVYIDKLALAALENGGNATGHLYPEGHERFDHLWDGCIRHVLDLTHGEGAGESARDALASKEKEANNIRRLHRKACLERNELQRTVNRIRTVLGCGDGEGTVEAVEKLGRQLWQARDHRNGLLEERANVRSILGASGEGSADGEGTLDAAKRVVEELASLRQAQPEPLRVEGKLVRCYLTGGNLEDLPVCDFTKARVTLRDEPVSGRVACYLIPADAAGGGGQEDDLSQEPIRYCPACGHAEIGDDGWEVLGADFNKVICPRCNSEIETVEDPPPKPEGLRLAPNDRDGEHHYEWHFPCGCALHPEDNSEKHGGAPHIHPCEQHKPAPDRAGESTREQRVNSEALPLTIEEAEEAYNNAEPVEISEEEIERLVNYAKQHADPPDWKQRAKQLGRIARKLNAERRRLLRLLNEDNMTHAESVDRILNARAGYGEGYTAGFRSMRAEALRHVHPTSTAYTNIKHAEPPSNPIPPHREPGECARCKGLPDPEWLRSKMIEWRDNCKRAEADREHWRQEAERLREGLEQIAESNDAGRHDGLSEPCPAHDATTMWALAHNALKNSTPPTPGLSEEELWREMYEALEALEPHLPDQNDALQYAAENEEGRCLGWHSAGVRAREALEAAREQAEQKGGE